ncbi:GNAT family N-acetyltransferase [Amycolatopsis jiangsuensis]|uniref:GNAT superfamily N-acetyltransferase n=1 Tax=Amycolatopsis jiangsuensis TaxID=1181879 RepID=A0A840IR36_9PSEU|nr:GNAT family N-acetyltransferase [Amycolatopsis jiangsuensis]MBB4684293.1 GNAT superfamily N-acetyltransferase [Amycolatopsis jiangsuensis]
MTAPEITLLPPSAAGDAALVAAVSTLINLVYAHSEEGLWTGSADRTAPGEIAGFVAAGEIAVARLGGRVVGCARVRSLDAGTGEFGLLAAAPAVRGTGLGRELVRFAEERGRAAGHRRMQLELLVPREGTHPAKEFLDRWYRRLGYGVVGKSTLDADFPQLAPLLAVPCDLLVYHKDLAAS